MLESLDLAYGLCKTAADRWREYFHGLDDAVRVNNESTTQLNPKAFVVYPINLANVASSIGNHVKWDAPIDHLRKFMIVPHLVHKDTIYADG